MAIERFGLDIIEFLHILLLDSNFHHTRSERMK